MVASDIDVSGRTVADGAGTARGVGRRSPVGRVSSGMLRGAGRVLLWIAIVVVLVRGLGAIAGGSQSRRDVSMRTRAADAASTQAQAEGAFAARFASLYLSWQPKGGAAYASAVDGFLASGLRDAAAKVGLPRSGSGEMVALATVARSESLGSGRAIITVACSLSDGQVRYLAVPVAETAGGGLDVFALPALVAPPAAGSTQALSTHPLPVDDAAQVENLARGFLTAYLSGKQGSELAGWVAPGSVIAAMPAGLSLQSLESVGVIGGAHVKRLMVLVRARVNDNDSRAAYQLSYRLTLRRDTSGWRVAAVAGVSA